MPTDTLKNDTARELIGQLEKAKADFEQRKRGRDWVAMVMTVANTFPEDKHAIMSMFKRDNVRRKPSGKSRDATPKISAVKRPGKTCADCPDSVNKAVFGSEVATVKQKDKVAGLRTTEDVLGAFENDAEMLAQYAKSKGINIGRSKKGHVIARKIAHYNREQAGEGKSEEE